MYITRIVLENVRGFDRLDFAMHGRDGAFAGWSVVTGDNASGKTTLLKAIALALVGPDVGRALQPSLRGWIREGCDEATIAVELSAGPQDSFEQGKRFERPFWSELRLSRNGGPEVTLGVGQKYRGQKKGPTRGPWAENPQGWFACGYGPFRRLYGASPEAQRIMSGPPRVARFATMFREDATLGECELWLRDLQYKKLEGREREGAILEQVVRLLNNDFLRNGLKVERIDSEGLWLRDGSGTVLPLADMSDGYRAALAMLTDVLRHIVDVYGHDQLLLSDESDLLRVAHQGVVLIDEVDSHLHPEWQRQIGFWLKERFPKIQFLVTSHSAFICQAADAPRIYHLPASGTDEKPFQLESDDFQTIVRSKADAIYLTPAFGMKHTRSPLAVRNRRRYAELSAKSASGGLSQKERSEHQRLFAWVETDED